MSDSFYSEKELKNLGLKKIGKNVLISRKTSFYSPEEIEIGDFVRIDDFCILSGHILIKNHVHISSSVSIYGGDVGVEIGNHVCVSVKCSLFAISDDFSGKSLVGPMEAAKYRAVIKQRILIQDYCVIGCNSVLLPGAVLFEGVAVGALSLVKGTLKSFGIYGGNPCRLIKKRKTDFLNFLNL